MAVQIKEVAQSTYSLDCGKDTVFSLPLVAYLLADDQPVLIDPGSTLAASDILSSSKRLGVDLQNLAYIIPTHIHLDHGGGAGYLAQHLLRPTVVLHPKGAGHMADPSGLVRSARLVFGQNFEKILGPVLPVPQERIHVASDGEVILLGKRDLRIIFSPGHAAHHIAIMDSLTGGLFCGDALGFISETMPDIPFPVGLPPFDPGAYLETVDKLAALSPKMIFYAHHGARSDVNELIGRVKEICTTMGEIIQKALRAGEDEPRISELVLQYVKGFSKGAELPVIIEAGISGYIQYYRNNRNKGK